MKGQLLEPFLLSHALSGLLMMTVMCGKVSVKVGQWCGFLATCRDWPWSLLLIVGNPTIKQEVNQDNRKRKQLEGLKQTKNRNIVTIEMICGFDRSLKSSD